MTRSGLAQVLPVLLEKTIARSERAVVRLPDAKRLEHVDRLLWTYSPESFLPHGSAESGYADQQPIFLTKGEDRPNGAAFLFLIDGAAIPSQLADWARLFILFDGADDQAVSTARDQWRALKDHKAELIYYQQTERGGWTEKMRA